MPKILDGDGRKQDTKGPLKGSKYAAKSTGSVGTSVLLPVEDSRDVVACVNAVLAAGDAIMFSHTTGGGVLAITVYSQGYEATKFYARDVLEVGIILGNIEEAANG